MTNHGIGSKFVSMNLNKSYGQPSNSFGTARSRPTNHVGVAGGMGVVSKPRSSQKIGQKLSVPAPLNLPSLRKEHERFDSTETGGCQAGGGNSGNGSRPNSSGMSWTKPSEVVFQEKDGVNLQLDVKSGGDTFGNGASYSSLYVLPSTRMGTLGVSVLSSEQGKNCPLRKSEVLRVEDFPSLQTALPSAIGPIQRQKNGLQQRRKHAVNDESHIGQKESSHSSSFVHRLHHIDSSHNSFGKGLSENHDNLAPEEKIEKAVEYFRDPLPIVHLNPRFDWADDERDTSHGLSGMGKDHGIQKGDGYWDKKFDIPRSSLLPYKPNVSDRWAQQRDDKTGKVLYGSDVRIPSREGREGNSWRSSNLQTDGFSSQEAPINRNVARHSVMSWETSKGNYGTWDTAFVRRDVGYGHSGANQWNYTAESHSIRGSERNTRCGGEQYNRHIGDGFQNNSMSKYSFSSGVNGFPINDPLLNFGKEKCTISKNEKMYLDDSFCGASGFDVRDPFSGDLVGVVKKKKDLPKPVDYHDDLVRETFEAELERVQKMQEQERVVELSRREEEERVRLAREHEIMQRRSGEESREAVWRFEQERLEATQRVENQRIVREEEKQRVVLEEERRKQAAKQKLQKLEERIAKRHVEQTKGNEKSVFKEDIMGDWEDGERMVERIRSTSDSLNLMRVKPVSTWRRGVIDNASNLDLPIQEHDSIRHSPRQGRPLRGKGFPRNDLNGRSGFMFSKNYNGGDGILDSHLDGFSHLKGQRWNLSGNGDNYGGSADNDSEFHGNFVGDDGWNQGRSHPHPYQQYQNSYEADSVYSFGKPRYSMRQPRVLPPPTVANMHKMPLSENCSAPSTLIDNEMYYNRASRKELEHHELSEMGNAHHQGLTHDLGKSTTPRCESQSSLSVSSPPISPANPSHDDLDECAEGEDTSLSGNRPDVLTTDDCTAGDDEEWIIENNEELQEHEEYDEEPDGYHREDEAHKGDSKNVELTEEYDDSHLVETDLTPILGFNEGIEVRMPSVECDRKSQNEVHGQKFFDSFENPVKGFGIASSSFGQTCVSTVASSALTQAELSMKFQFGLFSGPSLIPSPVPSILIGSIQMPLHLHTEAGPNLSHIHLSQPPLFQFGQLRYASSISQGILPLGPQPNLSARFSLNQNSGGPSTIPNCEKNDTIQLNIFEGENVLSAAPENGLNSTMSKSGPVVNTHVLSNQESQGHTQIEHSVSASFQRKRDLGVLKARDVVYGRKGKKFYNARTYGLKSSFIVSEASSHSDSSGYQRRYRRNIPRTEFRVQENGDRRLSSGINFPNQHGQNDNSNFIERTKSGTKDGPLLNKVPIRSYKSNCVNSGQIDSGSISVNDDSGERNSKKIICSKADDDSPLESGMVLVFEQPGIELLRDDDFIEVRSKRKIMNDRREHKEKEIKAKSHAPKILPKMHQTQSIIVSTSSNKLSGELVSNGHSDLCVVSQTMAPIGTPPANPDGQADIIRSQTIKPGTVDNVQMSLGWGNVRPNQQVMKPAQFEMHVSSIGHHSNSVNEPSISPSSSPIMSEDKSLTSLTQSPVNSLLAGEKIQFGAITSPSILHHRNPAFSQTDIQMSLNISSALNNCTLLEESRAQLEDSEAEASASAVAVAAISSDGIGKRSLSFSDNKSIRDSNIDEMNTGLLGDQKTSNHSRVVESLSVALPADHSVETPPISMWPRFPSPHNSPSHMVSHFPGVPPSHFPLYDINPILGGPAYTFEPHEESSSTQSQPPKSSASGSASLGEWQHHSSADSFYGHHHGGYNSHFISHPGVQGPPHMVVYNHFAPVGQFGQIGLSFMGATYIPSGKESDWKHNPTSASMGSEGDWNNMNVVSAQRNPPIQHLAPGTPLLPMFDMSPFQGSLDLVQARWPHIAGPPPFHSVPQSLQHQQSYGVLPSHFNHVDHELSVRRFPDPQTSLPSDSTSVIQQDPAESTKASLSSTPVPQNVDKSSQQKNACNHNHNHNYQRGDEWSHQRMGFQGRNQSSGPDKGIPSTRVKQVYVAKQTST